MEFSKEAVAIIATIMLAVAAVAGFFMFGSSIAAGNTIFTSNKNIFSHSVSDHAFRSISLSPGYRNNDDLTIVLIEKDLEETEVEDSEDESTIIPGSSSELAEVKEEVLTEAEIATSMPEEVASPEQVTGQSEQEIYQQPVEKSEQESPMNSNPPSASTSDPVGKQQDSIEKEAVENKSEIVQKEKPPEKNEKKEPDLQPVNPPEEVSEKDEPVQEEKESEPDSAEEKVVEEQENKVSAEQLPESEKEEE